MNDAGGPEANPGDAPPPRRQGPVVLPTSAPARYRRLRAFAALYRSAARELSREPLNLFWIVGFPVLFLVLFGTVFAGGDGPTLSLGLAAGQGRVASAVREALSGTEGVDVTEGSRDGLLESMRHGDVDGVLEVPADADARVAAGQVDLQLTVDPANANMASILSAVVSRVARDAEQRVRGQGPAIGVQASPINGRVLGTLDYVLPGILTLALLQLGLFGTAIPLISLRQNGVLRQLGVTPLPRGVLAASQIAFRLTLSLLLACLIVGVAIAFYGVDIAGNIGLLALLVLFGAAMMIAAGYLLASRIATVENGNGLLTAVFTPAMVLSGLFFPLDAVPAWVKGIASVIPVTYLADALRQVMVEATPQYPLALDLAVLAAGLAIPALLAVRLFRWE